MTDELQLSIEKMIYGGEGLAHAEGKAVFVPFVLPGEEVRATVRTRKKNLIHAGLLEVEKAAATRIAAKCPHFGVCGGCHYQHIEFGEQVKLKKEIVRETGWRAVDGRDSGTCRGTVRLPEPGTVGVSRRATTGVWLFSAGKRAHFTDR
jgi:tRNA/tmRNA/rRNA uracil-C5-methylase (TrmA/RlmC/RlmD family)